MSYHELGKRLQQANSRELEQLIDRPLTFASFWQHISTLRSKQKISDDIRLRFGKLDSEKKGHIITDLNKELKGDIKSLELFAALIDLKITKDIKLPMWILSHSSLKYLYSMGYEKQIQDLLIEEVESMSSERFAENLIEDGSYLLTHLDNLCKYIDLEKFIMITPDMYTKMNYGDIGTEKIRQIFMGIPDDIIVQFIQEFAHTHNDLEYTNRINKCMELLIGDNNCRRRLQSFVNVCTDRRTPLCAAIRSLNMIAIDQLIFYLHADINLPDESGLNPYRTLHHPSIRAPQEFIDHVENIFRGAPASAYVSVATFVKTKPSNFKVVPHPQPSYTGSGVQSRIAFFSDIEVQQAFLNKTSSPLYMQHLVEIINDIIDSENADAFAQLLKCPVICEIIPQIKFNIDGVSTSIQMHLRSTIVQKNEMYKASEIPEIANEMDALQAMLVAIS